MSPNKSPEVTEVDAAFARTVKIVDDKIARSDYTDEVCRNCPYDHTCCDSLVAVTMIEAIVLAKHIDARPDRWTIIRRLRERYQLLRQAYHKIVKLPDGDLTTEYFSHHVKCALYENGRCSAYDVRPISCREAYTDLGNDCHFTSTLVNTHGQDMLINVAQQAGLDSSNLGFKEMNTALLEIFTQKPLRDYFTLSLVAKFKREGNSGQSGWIKKEPKSGSKSG